MPGATCLDVFGGVSLGGIDPALMGVQHIAVELEERFHQLGLANVALWEQCFGHLPQWVRPMCLHGDSRALQAVLAQAGYACAISSPPYANALHPGSGTGFGGLWADPQRHGTGQTSQVGHAEYGTSPAQLGNTQGPTFWEAARDIVAGVFQVLKPGGVAIWVVKAYCRDGKIVDFPGDWRRMCEHLGFQTLHEHHALLTEDHGVQTDLFAGDVPQQTLRASFFRRLHMKKRPDLAILHETVYCMVKPLSAAPLPPDDAWQQLPLVDCTVASPPFGVGDSAGPESLHRRTDASAQNMLKAQGWHGGGQVSPGNLGALPAGRVEAVLDCIVASPPYADGNDKRGTIDWSKTHHGSREKAYGSGRSSDADGCTGYGTTPGQLGALPAGRVEAVLDVCIASPPYASSDLGKGGSDLYRHVRLATGRNPESAHATALTTKDPYGKSDGQLGAMREGRKP